MDDLSSTGKGLLVILLIAYFFAPLWIQGTNKPEVKESPKPKSLLDHLYKYFLIFSLSLIGALILLAILMDYFERAN